MPIILCAIPESTFAIEGNHHNLLQWHVTRTQGLLKISRTISSFAHPNSNAYALLSLLEQEALQNKSLLLAKEGVKRFNIFCLDIDADYYQQCQAISAPYIDLDPSKVKIIGYCHAATDKPGHVDVILNKDAEAAHQIEFKERIGAAIANESTQTFTLTNSARLRRPLYIPHEETYLSPGTQPATKLADTSQSENSEAAYSFWEQDAKKVMFACFLTGGFLLIAGGGTWIIGIALTCLPVLMYLLIAGLTAAGGLSITMGAGLGLLQEIVNEDAREEWMKLYPSPTSAGDYREANQKADNFADNKIQQKSAKAY